MVYQIDYKPSIVWSNSEGTVGEDADGPSVGSKSSPLLSNKCFSLIDGINVIIFGF